MISEALDAANPYIAMYKTARELLRANPVVSSPYRVILSPQTRLLVERGPDQRRENIPVLNDVAVILANEYEAPCFRDIVLGQRLPDQNGNDSMSRVSPGNASYMPLSYPFDSTQPPTIFICTYALANVGLNLQKNCSHCWFFDVPTDEATRQQARCRVVRLGNPSSTVLHREYFIVISDVLRNGRVC